MKKEKLILFSFLLIILGLSPRAGAQDFGWMRPGVRVWYFGGTSGLTTSNAVEAYLITAIAGGNVQYLRHSALEFWTSPRPVENLVAPVNDKGSFWMHPVVLQTLAPGEYWMDQEILTVTRDNYTYATLLSALGVPYNLLPSKALFDLQAQRQIVKITYTIGDTYSIGRAFFDAETGLVLCRDAIFEGYTVFFLLSEINYNFAQQTAFAEDGGPHCGFKSRVAESAFAGGGHSGGIVDIQSGVETRYGNKIEMYVMSMFNGPLGLKQATENYYFDGDVPIVRHINHDQAGTLPPDQWNAFGQYLWWWLPPTVTQGNAFSVVALAVPTINVFDVSMTKTADQPLTYTATQSPQQFYFSTLWFDDTGYLTKFSAKDPTIGLDIDGNSLFANGTTVDGLSYYRNTMGIAIPVEQATIHLSKSSLAFGTSQGSSSTSTQPVIISNSGEGTLNWTATPHQGWIELDTETGIGTAEVQVSVDTTGLSAGTYHGEISVTAAGATNSPQTISVTLKVYSAGTTSPPFGYFDTPIDGTGGIEGSVPVTGWALDDIEVTKVDIWRDPVGGEPVHPNGYVYIGDAVFVEGARPDVEAAYPAYPLNYRAGWGYMILTNFLPDSGNGTFRIHAIAHDREGHSVKIATKAITCDNAHATMPFGAIDTPAQGGTVSGSDYVNFGWALTPPPKFIPTDGSTIWLWIDGLPVGHPTYNNYRVDIATLFPGYTNSQGAVGYYYLDTTAYANGVHTMAWSVMDSEGVPCGIGSRYFSVMNTGAGGAGEIGGLPPTWLSFYRGNGYVSSIAEVADIPTDFDSPVYVKKGYRPEDFPEVIFPDEKGVINVDGQEVERIEIAFMENEAVKGSIDKSLDREKTGCVRANDKDRALERGELAAKSDHNCAGYLVAGNVLRPLPIGSTLDLRRGVFSWQPGPGFVGEYNFVFVSKDEAGSKSKKSIRIKILPAYSTTKQ